MLLCVGQYSMFLFLCRGNSFDDIWVTVRVGFRVSVRVRGEGESES